MDALGFTKHDHSNCISGAMAAAEARCADEKLQFTPVRRRVLEILLEQHRALGAYEILDILREEGIGSQPPVAYRALDFLVANGFAHKIEQLNAFVACAHPDAAHSPVFMICRQCSHVAEAHANPANVLAHAMSDSAGFKIERCVIEAEGLCASCAANPEGAR